MNHDNEKGCGKSALNLFSFALHLFACILCIALLSYLWGPSVIRYASSFFQAIGDVIKPVGSIIVAVLVGFIFLKAAADFYRP